MRPFKSYIICTSPRSGSTLLCRLLRQVSGAGYPDSHFHHPSLEKWLGYHDLKPGDFTTRSDALTAAVRAAYKIGRGGAEIFGLRLQRGSFAFFTQQLAALHPELSGDKYRIERAFGAPLFIHLTRQNKLDQAVSFVKAVQSGLWHIAPDGTEIERSAQPQMPQYDAAALTTSVAEFVRADQDWNDWFRTERIEPMRVTYSDLSADPHGQLFRITSTLGLDGRLADTTTLPTGKLRDATNRAWADRYRSEFPHLQF